MEPEFTLVGMERERQRLRAAFRNRESIAVLGPQGSGKTKLICECLVGEDILYLHWQASLHVLLLSMARVLIAARHTAFLRRARLRANANSEAWLVEQPSVHLKGLLWNAMEDSPAPMVLDGVTGAGFPTYRFLQRLYHAPV